MLIGSCLLQRRVEIERDQPQKLGILHLSQQHLSTASSEEVSGQLLLAFDHLVDSVLHRPSADELMHEHVAFLPDAKGAIGGLRLDGRVPPSVEMYDVRGCGEIEASAASLQR